VGRGGEKTGGGTGERTNGVDLENMDITSRTTQGTPPHTPSRGQMGKKTKGRTIRYQKLLSEEAGYKGTSAATKEGDRDNSGKGRGELVEWGERKNMLVRLMAMGVPMEGYELNWCNLEKERNRKGWRWGLQDGWVLHRRSDANGGGTESAPGRGYADVRIPEADETVNKTEIRT